MTPRKIVFVLSRNVLPDVALHQQYVVVLLARVF